MTLIEGRARFADAHTVVIGGKRDHRRQDPDRHRRPSRAPAGLRRARTASPPTRPSIWRSCPSASPSSAAAISPSSSPASSTAWAARSACSIAASRSCAASTTICAMGWRRSSPARGSTVRLRRRRASHRARGHGLAPASRRRRHPGGRQGHGRHRPSPQYRRISMPRLAGVELDASRRRRRRCLFARRASRTSTPSAM